MEKKLNIPIPNLTIIDNDDSIVIKGTGLGHMDFFKCNGEVTFDKSALSKAVLKRFAKDICESEDTYSEIFDFLTDLLSDNFLREADDIAKMFARHAGTHCYELFKSAITTDSFCKLEELIKKVKALFFFDFKDRDPDVDRDALNALEKLSVNYGLEFNTSFMEFVVELKQDYF